MSSKTKKEVITSTPETVLYRLTRRFSDGAETHEAGAHLRFVEGGAPRSAVLVSEQEVPELDLTEVPEITTDDDDE